MEKTNHGWNWVLLWWAGPCSVQFSCSVMSYSARLPCPSPTPTACSNSCPWSRWCHPTISSSVILFSSRLQSFSASGSFPMSQLFATSDQSIEASPSVLLIIFRVDFLQDWLVWSLCCSRDSQESSPAPQFESLSSLTLSSLVAQMVKHLPAVRETGFSSWVGKFPWRRKWQSTPALLPGKSHGRRSLIGYSPWGHKGSQSVTHDWVTPLH